DYVPDFQRQPLESNRRSIPVLARILLPFGPDFVMAFADRRFAFGDALREFLVAGNPFFADARQFRNTKCGVAKRADGARLHPAIVHGPFADVYFAEADLDV